MAARGTRSAGSTGGPGRGRPRGGNSGGTPNLWPRRILTTAGLVLIVLLLVVGLWQIFRVISGSSDASGAQSGAGYGASPSPSSTSSEAVIEECSASNLSIQTTLDGGSGTVGKGATFAVSISHAAGQPDCSTAVGQLAITVVSGNETIYDSSACSDASPSATPLLFSGDDSWSGSLSWDGKMYQGCTPIESNGQAKVADSGTYRVQVSLGGKPVGQEVSFDVK